jgi:2-hydroxy-6-oxo-6-(2'-aminophenyl)hexa-2,4-dienoate hydrolase
MAFDAKAHQYESRWADAGGIKTHYIEAGRGDAVVLIHGGGPGADGLGNWYSTIPLLAERNRVIAVDMLGFGKTEKPDAKTFTYSQDARTSHMIAFVEALGLESVSLVGNSMGGITSLGATIRRPDLVKKLVLMGSAGIQSVGIPAALGPLMAYDGTEEAMKKVVRALTHPEFAMDDGMVRYRVEVSNSPGTREALGATMGWVKSQGGLFLDENEIRKVKTPTLVVGGKNDPIVTLDNNVKFLELIEHSWGYFIPRTGHWVMVERPAEFAAVTGRFLAESA